MAFAFLAGAFNANAANGPRRAANGAE